VRWRRREIGHLLANDPYLLAVSLVGGAARDFFAQRGSHATACGGL
jgi:hypothetical protein